MSLSETMSRLKRNRASFTAANDAAGRAQPAADRLTVLAGMAHNPGGLRARCYVPQGIERPAPLLVVLHGCTQSAAAYDHGSGWSRLADRHGFALLFPEQRRENNPNLCFNWFSPDDVRRGGGEAASIGAMVGAMKEAHPIDPARIFVTGLSAGGAMAAAMLATYPEVFAGGAIIAGVPYGCAANVAQAFECMGGRAAADPRRLAEQVRRASSHRGPWPKVSIWQGTADRTVMPDNADALVAQWTGVHGLPAKPDRVEVVDGFPRQVWLGADGAPLIEHYSVTGMGHGTPLMPGDGAGQSGAAQAHMLDVGLSSTDRIATFFGLAAEAAASERPAAQTTAIPVPVATAVVRPSNAPIPLHQPRPAAQASGIQKVIEDALRTAGLMR